MSVICPKCGMENAEGNIDCDKCASLLRMRTTRRRFLKTMGTGTVAAALAGMLPSACRNGRKSNIILIMADDFGYECLSCNGGGPYRTPALDSLAAEGVRFTQCRSTPLCTPSRVQILTGKYNFRNYTEFGSLRPGEQTFGHLFQAAGYITCAAGKWQLSGHYEGSNYRGLGTKPENAGFDQHCLWQVDKLGSRYWDPVIHENGRIREDTEGQYGPYVVSDFVLDFITQNSHNPFLIFYPMILTHTPFAPTPESRLIKEDRKPDRSYFRDMVAYTDVIVGRINRHLETLGLKKDTLIIFTGDNGSPRGIQSTLEGRPYPGGKGLTTEAGTHVPLITNWKGRGAGHQVCESLIDFTDFWPTLAEAAGIPLQPEQMMDGRSFLPQIKGRSGSPRDWIFCDYEPKWGKWEPRRYVQNSCLKLYDDGRIFNIREDAEETNPLPVEKLDSRDLAALKTFRLVLRNMSLSKSE